jgi:hypothetical protein
MEIGSEKCTDCTEDCTCTLDGSTHDYKYRGNDLRIGIWDKGGELKAVDFEYSGEKVCFETVSGIRWIDNLIKLALDSGRDHEDILGTALVSSFQKGDIPGRFIEAMEEVSKTGRFEVPNGRPEGEVAEEGIKWWDKLKLA